MICHICVWLCDHLKQGVFSKLAKLSESKRSTYWETQNQSEMRTLIPPSCLYAEHEAHLP